MKTFNRSLIAIVLSAVAIGTASAGVSVASVAGGAAAATSAAAASRNFPANVQISESDVLVLWVLFVGIGVFAVFPWQLASRKQKR